MREIDKWRERGGDERDRDDETDDLRNRMSQWGRGTGEYRKGPANDDVERVPGIALGDDHVACPHGDRVHVGGKPCQRDPVQARGEIDAAEPLAPFSIHIAHDRGMLVLECGGSGGLFP